MKIFFNLLLATFPFFILHAQPKATASFHGCDSHCGIYEDKDYKRFGKVNWKFKTAGKIFSSPAVCSGIAYIGSEDHYLYAIDDLKGILLWKFETGGAIHSSPAVYDSTVYFGSFDGYYYAVDAITGKEKWRVQTGGERWMGGKGYIGMKPENKYMDDPWDFFLSSPILHKQDNVSTLFFGSSDGNVYAVDAENGTIQWKFKGDGPIHTTPAVDQTSVYVGSWDANLYALDIKSGKLKWKYKTGEAMAMTGIQSSPVVEKGMVYFGARDAHFYCLNAESGKVQWTYDAEGSWILGTATIKNNLLYVGTSDSYLFLALDISSGKEKYRLKCNGYVFSSPAITGHTAYVGDFTGKLFMIDLSEEKIVNEFATDARKKNAASVLNHDKLDFSYAATGKDLYLYDSTVDVMNKFYTLGSIVSSPVISNGILYVGSADGFLYSITLEQ